MSRLIMISISVLNIFLLSFPLLGCPIKRSVLSLYSLSADMFSARDDEVYLRFHIYSKGGSQPTIATSETFKFTKNKIQLKKMMGISENYSSKNRFMKKINADMTRIEESLKDSWLTYFDGHTSSFQYVPYLAYWAFRRALQDVRVKSCGGKPVSDLAQYKRDIKNWDLAYCFSRSLGEIE